MLSDGRWHTLEEIQRKMKLDQNQAQQTVAFLEEYNFVVADETKKKIKLNEGVRKFLI